LPDDLYSYYIVAPITTSGIAFLGDANKIAATGKIASIKDELNKLELTVLFAKGEASVILQGYSEMPVYTDKGTVLYNASTHLFTIILPSTVFNLFSKTITALIKNLFLYI